MRLDVWLPACSAHPHADPPGRAQGEAWTGLWPGTTDCEWLDLIRRWVDGLGWVPALLAIEPDGQPDFNRLYAACRRDPELLRWERR
ncbi:hypothetical protein Misp03_37080 [Microbispora sp. NBRC 16548]|nr:hypothetical protein Misp03_37080 [Microbispora sp. NBRC 16548]